MFFRYDVLSRLPSQKRPFKVVPTPVESTIDAGKTMKFDPSTWAVEHSEEFAFESQFLRGKNTPS
ncbi:hypothetical protein DPMN_030146 [Dreissena polymorpha]|uniref:Uncharacterized protein n=1 Tax=Dreissena polymorpha TaxID=45954 RepID=A0A9D4LZU0_DREPO|nr:hypothetical protein DPMN_030146 [Dreissena polymorpha]